MLQDIGTTSKSRTSARYRPVGQSLIDQVVAGGLEGPLTKQQNLGSRIRPQSRAQRPIRNTDDDRQIAPGARSRSQQLSRRRPSIDREDAEYEESQQDRKRTRKPSSQPRRGGGKHPLFWCGLTLLLVILFWIGSTNGASWFTSHFTDPGKFGPTQGTIVLGIFGGGDSPQKPTKLIALNNDGQVQLMKVTANDPAKGAQLVTGPNLVKQGFPDPTRAKVDLQVGDFDHDGKQDVKVMILATMFDFPFHRHQQAIILYGDGKGGLKSRQS